MDTKKLIPIVCMVSVLIMFIWGYFGSWQYSWIAVFAGGIVVVALSMFGKKGDGDK